MAEVGKKELYDLIDGQAPELWNMADQIFDHPETAFHEYFASNLLENWLEAHGFRVERGLGSLVTAFRAIWQQGEGGPSIGLLCEYDALPGLGHACGHHLQGAAIVAAANSVKEVLKDRDFRLVVYGTPAEEAGSGKIKMLREGYFQDIDVALMMHGSPTTTCDIKSMANYSVQVIFHGVSAHAAINPEKGRSALDGLLLAFQGVEFLREHVRDDVRIHYTVENTYDIPVNVIPDRAAGAFLLRSYNITTLEGVFQRFQDIVRGAALMSGTTAEVVVRRKVSNKIPVLKLNEEILRCAYEVGAPRISGPREKTGSTDFGDVMQKVPGSCIRVAFVPEHTASHSQGFLDHGKTEEGHQAIIYGAKILAATTLDLICDPNLMREIQEEFCQKKQLQIEEAG